LVSVAAAVPPMGSATTSGGSTPGGMQQRHAQIMDQHYALAQYQAQQQFAQMHEARAAEGDALTLAEYAAAPGSGQQAELHPRPAQSNVQPVMTRHLRMLGELREAGLLSDSEFASVKARVLR